MENNLTNKKHQNQSFIIDMNLLEVAVSGLSTKTLRKPREITKTAQQQLASTSDSSQIVDGFSGLRPVSHKETVDNCMKSGTTQWRRSKYGRNRQNYNNKLLYALVQLHNHYTHVISFLNKMMTLPPLDQEQPQELVKTKRLKHHNKH